MSEKKEWEYLREVSDAVTKDIRRLWNPCRDNPSRTDDELVKIPGSELPGYVLDHPGEILVPILINHRQRPWQIDNQYGRSTLTFEKFAVHYAFEESSEPKWTPGLLAEASIDHLERRLRDAAGLLVIPENAKFVFLQTPIAYVRKSLTEEGLNDIQVMTKLVIYRLAPK